MRQCCTPLAAASASGRALLPSGDSPYGLVAPPHTATRSIGPSTSVVPIGDRRYRWAPRCMSSPLRVVAPAIGPWPQSIAPLQVAKPWPTAHAGGAWPWPATPVEGLVVAGHPLSLLPLLRKRIEQFYAMQSHHMQFNTNLSHENLGFEIRMEKMKEDKRPLQGGVTDYGQGQPAREANDAGKGRCPRAEAPPDGHNCLQCGARKGLPPTASPAINRGRGVGHRGGRPLAERLVVGKGSRRLRRGSDSYNSKEGARGVRASFLEKDDPAPMNYGNFEDCPLIQNY
ncbi:hypothetical protein BHM03_00026798 [Ensete ventricosum]|uniref:Uncharacterized protein n=1 Tax=Ensete ventricosum TaxID=4639 RepID=A0A445MHC6_ENSVE|nr:hypothetical protein BHM03_00026798 [Ensete ventricosum]